MRKSLFCFAVSLALSGCGDDPVQPPADVVIVYDIQSIDRPGDRPAAPEDRPPTDVSTDRGPERCQMGSFMPCECAPTITGTRRCLTNGMLEATCRCDGFDAGPGDAVSDIAADTTSDQPATDAASTDAASTDATSTDVAAMDAASAD